MVTLKRSIKVYSAYVTHVREMKTSVRIPCGVATHRTFF